MTIVIDRRNKFYHLMQHTYYIIGNNPYLRHYYFLSHLTQQIEYFQYKTITINNILTKLRKKICIRK